MNYLDINKSVIISSPAGSGKTEKLARRYIALLKSGVDVERILAITFTEKAAAEMKDRILRILKDEEEGLFKKILEKAPLMRVSTMHSFSGTLLRRFSFEAGITPNYQVEEAIDSRITWEEILHEILMEEGEEYKLILQTISEKGFRGLENLKGIINYLYEKTPFSLDAEVSQHTVHDSQSTIIDELRKWPGAEKAIEGYKGLFDNSFERLMQIEKLFLTESKTPRKNASARVKEIADFRGWAERMYSYWMYKKMEEGSKRAERIRDIFRRCYERYMEKKGLRGVLDFSDLEYLSYKLLTEDPEWANILYAFDEKTDHILVDEFQDTNNFQWAIIDKLTEEWRSGIGAKREEGIKPTIFLVGDEKQSIYFFRGANVEIFHRAKEKLKNWLGEEFYYEEAKENYRSLPAIIDFTNHVFSRIMTAEEGSPPWMTRYSPLVPACSPSVDTGHVELIMLEDNDEESISQAKQREAKVIARRIQCLVNNFQIFDKEVNQQRRCKYADMAILLRKRTHLKRYEEALRQFNIPFAVVKGIGFYQEPEVAMLRAFVYFLSNPKDDYSLYVLMESPLFSVDKGTIIKAMNSEGDCLFTKVRNTLQKDSTLTFLEECLSRLSHTPISELMEEALIKTRAWEYFHEAGRRANIKKFIRIVEDLESDGKSLLKIRDFLERASDKEDEPKANVNTEGMNVVRIMTIHASKGLEFPVVFLPALEEEFRLRTNDALIYETEINGLKVQRFKYVSESAIRKEDRDYSLHLLKEREEQKRLFYVAVTRAESALFLISRWNDKDNHSPLSFLKNGLGLVKDDTGYRIQDIGFEGLSVLTEQEVNTLYDRTMKQKGRIQDLKPKTHYPGEFIPVKMKESPQWKSVTEVVNIRREHGKEWMIIGDVIHRVFEGISKGIFNEEEIRSRGERLLSLKGISGDVRERLLSIIEKDISLLKQKGIWQDIILPIPERQDYTELPFILEVENAIYSGRIDRVIVKDDIYNIYDYKTFPVREDEMDYLLKEYSFQMNIYKQAVRRLFTTKAVKSFIVFTHTGEVREV